MPLYGRCCAILFVFFRLWAGGAGEAASPAWWALSVAHFLRRLWPSAPVERVPLGGRRFTFSSPLAAGGLALLRLPALYTFLRLPPLRAAQQPFVAHR